jgi:hypothetical protein
MKTSGKNSKKRNSLAGTSKGQSESAKFFRDNPKSKAKKDAYNKEYHATEERKSYRVKLNKANRKSKTYGNKDGMDKSHTTSGKLVSEKQSTNRARNGKGSRPKKK